MKRRFLTLMLCLGLVFAPVVSAQQALTNTVTTIVVPGTGSYVCFPVSALQVPVDVSSACGPGAGSAATQSSTYHDFNVAISTPVPTGQSLRVDIGDFTSSSGIACTISAGDTSCSVNYSSGFTVTAGDILAVNFTNSSSSSSFMVTQSTWILQ